MAKRSNSDSMAFDPSPAIHHSIGEAIDRSDSTSPFALPPRLERKTSKGVTFNTATLGPRAQSITGSLPLLEPVSSASDLPRKTRQPVKVTNIIPGVDMNTYIENSRKLLETQRQNFEKERADFQEERKLWNVERAVLQQRIEWLEAGQGMRRSSHDSMLATSPQSFRKTFNTLPKNGVPHPRALSEVKTRQVWEMPASITPVTRVFPDEAQPTNTKISSLESNGLASISENESSKTPTPIPSVQFDPGLDGIILKPTAHQSSFSALQSPTLVPTARPQIPVQNEQMGEKGLEVDMETLLSPAEANLVRDAGHTPMLLGKMSSNFATSTGEPSSPAQTEQPNSKPTADRRRSTSSELVNGRPSERSDSYFSTGITSVGCAEQPPTQASHGEDNIDGDKPLKGPLILANSHKEGDQNRFLDDLDDRLLNELERSRSHDVKKSRQLMPEADADLDDGVPVLKLKRSLNFGSAYGSKTCGDI